MELNKYIDHTLLKPEATKKQIEQLCAEAVLYQFKSVCVNPTYVKEVAAILKGSDVLVCTVIGFPLGATTTEIKGLEAKKAIADGADEIDMVINIGLLKAQLYEEVLADICEVIKQAQNKVVKVIVETALLTEVEKIKICELVLASGANFIKTSTGFSTGGATAEDIKLFANIIQGRIGIKASGGIKTKQDAENLIVAGATRLGTSGGIQIVLGEENNKNY